MTQANRKTYGLAPEMIGWGDFQGVIELMQKGLQAEEEVT